MDKTEVAWRVLDNVNEWIRFADAKAGAALAGAGLLGASLAQAALGPGASGGSAAAVAMAAIAGLLAAVSAIAAGYALIPRLRVGEPASTVYFEHVARRFRGDPAGHRKAFARMLDESDALLDELAGQIWATSQVARMKYLATGIALLFLLGAVLCAGAAALLAA